jgi:ATP-dependent exoDNAse (exonuclease V) beta subunit
LEFTEEQIKAIDISRLGEDACIVAGPGSGKTTVLVERYQQLVAQGIEPSEILAITFTEKAAANMREKLAEKFNGQPELLRKLERAHVSTIHGFCSRLLKENAAAAGVDPEFTILDEQAGALEQARMLRETLDGLFHEKTAAMTALLDAVNGQDLESLIPGVYDAMRAAGVRPSELRGMPRRAAPAPEEVLGVMRSFVNAFPALPTAPQRASRDSAREWIETAGACCSPVELLDLLSDSKSFNLRPANPLKDAVKAMREEAVATLLDEIFVPERDLLIEIFERFDSRYRDRKTTLAALDFNDLEFFAVRLLDENPAVRGQINQQFRQVMIDEFQDTSAQQSRLVNLIRAPGAFYAVGDLNQSIYSFRHASPAVFQQYRESVEETGGHVQELIENWRSREPVLLATQLVLDRESGITPRALIPARQLPPREHACIETIAAAHDDEDEARRVEASCVVSRIVDLLASLRIGEDSAPARPSDFAILMRNTTVVDPYLDALTQAGLAYNLNRRSGFLETREARDLLHLLRMIHNPRDEVSTLAVLRSEFAGISDEGILRLKMQRPSLGEALAHPNLALFDTEDRVRLERFLACFARCRAAAPHVSADRLILRLLDEMGIVWDVRTAQRENIEKFLGIARANAAMTLGELVTYLNALREANPREQDSPIDETRDAVQIMSTHAAKGLEFPVVILAAMDKGVDSNRTPVLNYTPENGLGVKWSRNALEPISGFVHLENKTKISRTEEEEANRLLYVAMTRAKEHLILSWTQKPGKKPTHWARKVSEALVSGTQSAPNGQSFEVRAFSATAPAAFSSAAAAGNDREVMALGRPILTEQFETNVTATALSTFASCPRKYYLGQYLGWDGDLIRPHSLNQSMVRMHGAADIGTEVHALLAGLQPPAPDLESIRLAQVFERSALSKRARRAARREQEWDFVLAAGDLIVRGTVDLWFEDAQGLTLVDYKTDDVPADKISGKARDYALQIEIYALALERFLGRKPAQAWLYFLRPDVAFALPPGGNLSGTVEAFIAAQENLAFPLNVGAHCHRCPFFRTICPARV